MLRLATVWTLVQAKALRTAVRSITPSVMAATQPHRHQLLLLVQIRFLLGATIRARGIALRLVVGVIGFWCTLTTGHPLEAGFRHISFVTKHCSVDNAQERSVLSKEQ